MPDFVFIPFVADVHLFINHACSSAQTQTAPHTHKHDDAISDENANKPIKHHPSLIKHMHEQGSVPRPGEDAAWQKSRHKSSELDEHVLDTRASSLAAKSTSNPPKTRLSDATVAHAPTGVLSFEDDIIDESAGISQRGVNVVGGLAGGCAVVREGFREEVASLQEGWSYMLSPGNRCGLCLRVGTERGRAWKLNTERGKRGEVLRRGKEAGTCLLQSPCHPCCQCACLLVRLSAHCPTDICAR